MGNLYNKVIKYFTLPYFFKRDGLGGVIDKVRFLKESQYWEAEKIEKYQIEQIRNICIHAYKHSSFYKKRFNDCGFEPNNFNKLSQLKVIPPLTKGDLKKHLEEIKSTKFKANEIHKDATGGSTGDRTPFYRDNKSIIFKKAVEYRCNQWTGWDLGDKIAYYWPAIQDFQSKKTLKSKIKNALSYRSLMLYSGKLDDKILEEHYQKLSKFKPKLLRAFPNPLAILAKYIQEKEIKGIYIPAIITVGEPLLETQKKLFKEVFGSNVYNCYVSRECGNMACECDKHRNLHLNAEMVYFEYLNAEERKQPSKILITDLTNYGMPFIRYQIEDIGMPIDETCECGRNLPLIELEAGRITDFLISPVDKSYVSGASFLHHLIAEGPDVGQIQVVQDKINHLVLKIVKNSNYSKEKLAHFDKVIQRIFKGQMEYEIKFVDSIAHEKSGKYLFTKSLIVKE